MNGPDRLTEDDHDSPDRTAVTHTACRSLVIGPVDRCKGPSRENEQANTQRTRAYRRDPEGLIFLGEPIAGEPNTLASPVCYANEVDPGHFGAGKE